jgi:hypothetical protein
LPYQTKACVLDEMIAQSVDHRVGGTKRGDKKTSGKAQAEEVRCPMGRPARFVSDENVHTYTLAHPKKKS